MQPEETHTTEQVAEIRLRIAEIESEEEPGIDGDESMEQIGRAAGE